MRNLTPNSSARQRVGIAADHGGFELKQFLVRMLREEGHEIVDFGDQQPKPDEDYPDFVIPLARAVASGELERGIAICGSGAERHCRRLAKVAFLENKRPPETLEQ